MPALEKAVRNQVPTIAKALAALDAMEHQLTIARTYDQIRKIIKEASALKVLFDDVAEVKAKAEDAVLLGNRRIAEELRKVPKASGRPPKILSLEGKNKSSGRRATGVPGTSRHRLGKLAGISTDELKATASRLRGQGKDATVTAVVREITQGDKSERRAERERQLASRIMALPEEKSGAIVADPPWKFEPYSRETGMDRAADNHFPTMTTDAIAALDVASIAADDCVLFLWATVPMEPQAHQVMAAWGFKYVSQIIWRKPKPGTGYWFINYHEILLVGVRGHVPAPTPGTQWPSVIEAPLGKHSEKPEIFLQLVEEYFPTLPKIELYRRGPPRPGWAAWGNMVERD
jgi:N6-adenosine-specific RNA methylase IME4